jgi:hypothetical protein
MNNLEVFEGWTIDYRLKQLRRCKDGWENMGHIDFIDFDSDLGQAIFEKKLVIDELNDYEYMVEAGEFSVTEEEFLRRKKEFNEFIEKAQKVIDLLEKEQNNG